MVLSSVHKVKGTGLRVLVLLFSKRLNSKVQAKLSFGVLLAQLCFGRVFGVCFCTMSLAIKRC